MKYFLKKYKIVFIFFLMSTYAVLADTYVDNNDLIPSPPTQTDHRFASCLYDKKWKCTDFYRVPEKFGYHESLLKAQMKEHFISRKDLKPCGLTDSVKKRIQDCKEKNPEWSSYHGSQKADEYGKNYEGDWFLVTVIKGDDQYEIWQDQKTQLLWSDKTKHRYNWFRATGYAKPTAISIQETQFSSAPGVKEIFSPYKLNFALQPKSPISVCTSFDELNKSKKTAYHYVGPKHEERKKESENFAFKGEIPETTVSWKVPTRADWMMAEINGIRKVLPNMDFDFWSSTTGSDYRNSSWIFKGDYGSVDGGDKHISYFVRCVGEVRNSL